MNDTTEAVDEYEGDINAFQDALADALYRPHFIKALHAILYGDDQLRAACDMRREVKLAIFAYEQERIPGAPSAISKRLMASTIANVERLAKGRTAKQFFDAFKAGKTVEIPARDKP